jgi:hypothetical protein
MDAHSRLALVRVKVNRARRLLKDFDAEVASTGGKTIMAMVDSDGMVTRVPERPFNVLATAGDIVQNLRSALDHLAYQLLDVGDPKAPKNKVAFPIFKDAATYQTNKLRKVAGMRGSAIAAIDALQPYKGGNEKLWELHSLNNRDKHQLLFSVMRSHLWTDDGFFGGFLYKSNNPSFYKVAGTPTERTLQSTVHSLTDYVEQLIEDFLPHLSP